MYGLNRLNSTKNLRALFTAAAAAPSPIRLLRLNLTHSSCRSDLDDFVCVGKGYKIGGIDEIEESKISERRNTSKLKFSSKNHTYHRKVLPPKLISNNVVKLACESAAEGGICDVFLVGTYHDCEKSWREAHSVIKFLKPQVVFLELCSTRIYFLTGQPDKVPTMGEMLQMWKKNEDPFSILYKWFMAKVGSRQGIVSGEECRLAYKEAMKHDAKVILGDVPDEITTRRMLAKMSAWRYLFHPKSILIPKDLCKTAKDELERFDLVIQESCKKDPSYWVPFWHERDQYMSASLLKVARKYNSVVAVVGMGHLPGIQKHWKQPVDMKQLLDTATFTMGKTFSTFAAMVVYLSLPYSQICKIEKFFLK